MAERVPSARLRNREHGYELASSEHTMIFEKEDRGYVRIKNRTYGMFYLDPSPYLSTPFNEIYVSALNKLPPSGKLVRVTVKETDSYQDVDPITMEPVKIVLKIISGWEPVDPNKIMGNKLFNMEEFLHCVSTPISPHNLPFDDLEYCLGMYLVSAPQISNLEQGGINTVILGKTKQKEKWMNFKRMTSIIPSEFRRQESKNYYKSIEKGKPPKTPNSSEVSLAFLNRKEVPVHIPLPFEDLEFKKYYTYKEEFKDLTTISRAYMIDSLLFQPEIPKNLQRRVEEAMCFIVDDVLSAENLPCYQDIGSVVPKLTTSFARLNFNDNVTLADLNKGKELWYEAMSSSRKDGGAGRNKSKTYQQTPDGELLLAEILELYETGVPLTIENIKCRTKVHASKFEAALNKLKFAGKIYFPSNDTIGIIKS